jgi:hypothetical protein
MAREWFGRFMVQMGGKYCRPSDAIIGEHITDVTIAYGHTNRQAALIKKAKATGYRFGPLEASRKKFLEATKLTVEWESADGEPA